MYIHQETAMVQSLIILGLKKIPINKRKPTSFLYTSTYYKIPKFNVVLNFVGS